MFDQFVLFSMSEEKEDPVNCLSEGVISKEIKRIFQRGRGIIDEDSEKVGALNTALRYLSLDRERRIKGSFESQMLSMIVEEVSNPRVGVGLGCHRQRVWRASQDARLHQKREMCPERRLSSHIWYRGSPSILGRVEVACPRQCV